MRLWTLHPRYLDAKGLVALWREALLAQKVLRGRTKGYRHHPQLDRFRACPDSLAAIAGYLRDVKAEAKRRGYRFDGRKIGRKRLTFKITASTAELLAEQKHLAAKLRIRCPPALIALLGHPLAAHPVFRVTR